MKEKNDKKLNLQLSNTHFQKIVSACLLIGIIIVSGFIIYYILIPEKGFIILGLLNKDQEVDNNPINATVGENITFYVSVENHLNRDAEFKIYVLKGNNTTNNILHHNESGASINYTISNQIIKNGQEWISQPQNISFYELGENHMIIVELWEVLQDTSERYWDHDWFRLNITSS